MEKKQVRLDHPRIVALLDNRRALKYTYDLARAEEVTIVGAWLDQKLLEVNYDIVKTIEELQAAEPSEDKETIKEHKCDNCGALIQKAYFKYEGKNLKGMGCQSCYQLSERTCQIDVDKIAVPVRPCFYNPDVIYPCNDISVKDCIHKQARETWETCLYGGRSPEFAQQMDEAVKTGVCETCKEASVKEADKYRDQLAVLKEECDKLHEYIKKIQNYLNKRTQTILAQIDEAQKTGNRENENCRKSAWAEIIMARVELQEIEIGKKLSDWVNNNDGEETLRQASREARVLRSIW